MSLPLTVLVLLSLRIIRTVVFWFSRVIDLLSMNTSGMFSCTVPLAHCPSDASYTGAWSTCFPFIR